MELLKSEKIKLPKILFISKEELDEVPIGVPYIIGNPKDKHLYETWFEYNIILESCKPILTGFDWKGFLKTKGLKPVYLFYDKEDVLRCKNHKKEKYDSVDSEYIKICQIQDSSNLVDKKYNFSEFIKDTSCRLNYNVLLDLKLVPSFYQDIKDAITTNIQNFSVYNPYLYNKKLGACCGTMGGGSSESKNLIILDISGSMPKGLSSSLIMLSKTLSSTYFADVMITGTRTILYEHNQIHQLNINTIYDIIGLNNDQRDFIKYISKRRSYNNVLCFGDYDSPGYRWGRGDKNISDEAGKKINTWKVNNVISFHKSSDSNLSGYCRWFTPKTIKIMPSEWAKFFNY